MLQRSRAAIDLCAEAVADWLGSRAAFVQVCAGTLISVPLTVFAIDPHGFTFLYVATALSLVTQVPLAMIGVKARLEAQQAEIASALALAEIEHALDILEAQDQTQADMLRAVLALLEASDTRRR